MLGRHLPQNRLVTLSVCDGRLTSLPKDAGEPVDRIAEILFILKADSEQKALGTAQQSENTRYLNELNSVRHFHLFSRPWN